MELEKCINCKYFKEDISFDNGECRCMASKYYGDIVVHDNDCQQFVYRLGDYED